MTDTELEAAIERSAQNRAGRWPERTSQNRLEPECWPALNPGFNLASGSRVFTIGSCFARNVEQHLASLGFDVPARRFLNEAIAGGRSEGDEILNKYTPPSIYQELAWTKRIRDRDGTVTEEDIKPFLLDLGDGRVVDLQHRLTNQFGISRDKAIEQRRALYGLFANAFESETVIITLGLIECWLDRTTGQYVEFGPFMRKHNAGNRFAFRRLKFTEALEFTRKSIDLLLEDGPRNLMITTSPVPLSRTFTGDDVIVANTYSKSVLRAVAGQIAEEYPRVDYFPAYESVMLTKQTYVWTNDLTHVQGEFVARVVGRMCDHYVADGKTRQTGGAMDQWLKFANLIDHKRFDQAAEIFLNLDLEEPAIAPRFALNTAEMQLFLGQKTAALENARRAQEPFIAAGERGCLNLLRSAEIIEAVGHAIEADAVRARAVATLGNPGLIMSLIRRLATSPDERDLHRVIAHVEEHLSDNLDLLFFTIQAFELKGDFVQAERACRKGCKVHPDNIDLQLRLADLLLKNGKLVQASRRLNKVQQQTPASAAILKKLMAAHLEAKQFDDAAAVARTLVELSPDDADAELNLASALRRGGSKQQALVHARRAAELDPNNPRYQRYVQDLERANARG